MTLSTEDPEGRTTGGPAILYASATNNLADESQYSAKMNDNGLENPFDFEASINNVDLPFLERFNRVLFQRPGSRALSVPSYFPFASINHYTSSNLLNKPAQTDTKKRDGTSKSYKSSSKYAY